MVNASHIQVYLQLIFLNVQIFPSMWIPKIMSTIFWPLNVLHPHSRPLTPPPHTRASLASPGLGKPNLSSTQKNHGNGSYRSDLFIIKIQSDKILPGQEINFFLKLRIFGRESLIYYNKASESWIHIYNYKDQNYLLGKPEWRRQPAMIYSKTIPWHYRPHA